MLLYTLIILSILFVLLVTYSLLRISSPIDQSQEDADQIRFLDNYRNKH